jgi:hypothetical protein
MAGMFGGKKTRQEQLDEQMKKAGALMPDDTGVPGASGPMMGDGAYGMRKVRGSKRKATRRSGNNWPW